jgi:hypothetical protein
VRRRGGHSGAWRDYGTGKDGILINAGTVTLAGTKNYRYVRAGNINHAAVGGGAFTALIVRSLATIRITGVTNLNGLGHSGGAGGAGRANPTAGDNGVVGNGPTGGAAGAGCSAGVTCNGGAGGGATHAATSTLAGSGGGGGGGGRGDGAVGGTGGAGGAGGGQLTLGSPYVTTGNIGATSTNGSAGTTNVGSTGGTGGQGAGGSVTLTGRTVKTGTIDMDGGAGASDGVLFTRGGRIATGAVTNTQTGTPAAKARKRTYRCGVGGGRPMFASSFYGGSW